MQIGGPAALTGNIQKKVFFIDLSIAHRWNEGLSHVQCLSGNQLKIIAAVCMFIDHAAKVFYPSISYRILNPMFAAGQMSQDLFAAIDGTYHFLCSIGAIAFPVFAFLFAEGFCHTHSKKDFLLRLGLLALISEFPFDATFFSRYQEGTPGWPWYWRYQNIFFTYLLGLGVLWLWELAGLIRRKPFSLLVQGLILLIGCSLAEFLVKCDYGGFGVFLIAIAYVLRKNRLCQILGLLAAKLLIDRWYHPVSFLFSLLLILLYNGTRGEKHLKYFFYGFYPVHIALIGFLDWLIFSALWEVL